MARVLVVVLALVSLAGCGQMGPLYFNEEPPADQLPPSRKKPPAPVVPDAPLPAEPMAAPEDDAAKKPTP